MLPREYLLPERVKDSGVFQIILHIYQSSSKVGTPYNWLRFYITTLIISHEPVYEKFISLHFGGVELTNKEDLLLISNFVKYVTEELVQSKWINCSTQAQASAQLSLSSSSFAWCQPSHSLGNPKINLLST